MVDVVVRLAGPVAPGSDAPARITFHGGVSQARRAIPGKLVFKAARQPSPSYIEH
jgi:hypothetical protein